MTPDLELYCFLPAALLQGNTLPDLASATFVIAGGLFVLGAVTAVFRREPLIRLMGVVMVFAASALNLVAESGLKGAHGQAFAIFLAVECIGLSLTCVAVLAGRSRYLAGKDGGALPRAGASAGPTSR